MVRRVIFGVLAAVAAVSGLRLWLRLPGAGASRPAPLADTATVAEERFELWVPLEGRLAARRVVSIASRLPGGATIVELVPDGARVRAGDLLVKFDSFSVEADLARAERECAAAERELRLLETVTLPAELRETELAVEQLRDELATATRNRDDTAELAREQLASAGEVERENRRVEALRRQLVHAEWKLALARDHSHPLRLADARDKLRALESERNRLRDQLAMCTVTAPCDGEVVHLPVTVGTELRTVRVGDTVYRNQEFLCIPDPAEWVVRCEVAEPDLPRVRPGRAVRATFPAWPELTLTGEVESVSAMAQPAAGAAGRRVFPAIIRLDGGRPELRSGLSVRVAVLAELRECARVIPRAAVRWERGQPYCRLVTTGGTRRQPIVLGPADDERAVVLDGLSPGDRILW
ncbi:MAG: efflux RND transporter periplasmic adaptor subunit [Kiritimatiellae bacterium]|nr:efflux RND transporter periplasmic adaptor subunit [Kiritimatiellia bacterium]